MDLWTPDVVIERERFLDRLRQAEQYRLIKVARQGQSNLMQWMAERAVYALKQAVCNLRLMRNTNICSLAGLL